MIKEMLVSKRFWTIVVTSGAYLAVKFGFVFDAPAQEALAEQLVLVAGGVATIVTKVIDSRKK